MRALHELYAASAAKIQQALLPWDTASHAGKSRGAERKRLSWCLGEVRGTSGASKSCGFRSDL